MRRLLVPLSLAALAFSPTLARAQDVNAILRNAAVATSTSDPRAFTPAPVSELGPTRLAPSERAGGAADAGPMNATPFAGAASNVLTGSQTARALDDTSPDRDPLGATQFRN